MGDLCDPDPRGPLENFSTSAENPKGIFEIYSNILKFYSIRNCIRIRMEADGLAEYGSAVKRMYADPHH